MDFEVYCDESRQQLFSGRDRSGFVCLGSLWLESSRREHLKERIRELRSRHSVGGEFKWHRVSRAKKQFYLDLTELFFGEQMRFRAIVLPAEEMDAVRFHASDQELMFYKFYYQLLHHWILDQNRYRIFLDLKTNRSAGRVQTLERVLRNANLTSEILGVQALPSRQLDLMQLTDVLLGAVSYSFNGKGSSQAKNAVVENICAHLGRDEIVPTPRSRSRSSTSFDSVRREGGSAASPAGPARRRGVSCSVPRLVRCAQPHHDL